MWLCVIIWLSFSRCILFYVIPALLLLGNNIKTWAFTLIEKGDQTDQNIKHMSPIAYSTILIFTV